ncbi:MAG: cytochrome C [Roseiflexus castenholzii]|uniref:c-type cytochrome n=1 Tax=Roseiflexus castenholzii TaxID=120962 RepID=UPI000CCB7E89|nr:MAG: cytochrome C [Roseiflexus castenholzii]
MQPLIRMTIGVALVLGALLLAANTLGRPPAAPASGPIAGDATRGQIVFERAGCSACHTTGTEFRVGTGMAGVLQPEGPVYPPGVNYGGLLPNGAPRTEENVAAFIRATNQGQIGIMPGRALSDQQMADLIAYLRTLTR